MGDLTCTSKYFNMQPLPGTFLQQFRHNQKQKPYSAVHFVLFIFPFSLLPHFLFEPLPFQDKHGKPITSKCLLCMHHDMPPSSSMARRRTSQVNKLVLWNPLTRLRAGRPFGQVHALNWASSLACQRFGQAPCISVTPRFSLRHGAAP